MALAVVQIGVMPAAGGLVAGGGAVMYGKLGGGDPEPPAAGGKGKGTGERKGFSSEEIQEHFVRENGQGATMGERAGAETQGVSARKLQAVYEKHHLLVRQLHKWFHDQLGFDIDKYTVKISGDEHRLVHNYYRWNDLWKDFMKQHPTASKAAIRAHMKTMMKNVGLEGLPIVPYK